MLTPETIHAEVKRRIQKGRDDLAACRCRIAEAEEDQIAGREHLEDLESDMISRNEALEELDQWIAGEMAKQAREWARQHYDAELAKVQNGGGNFNDEH